jgi:hypothetical protein
MFKYHAFGLNIASELELPGILKGTDNDADVNISLGKIMIPTTQDNPNYHVDQSSVYLWWDDIGRVKISNGNEIIVDLINEDENEMIPFLLGPVMALILHQRGFLVLHGSSVKINNTAIAFLGHRGFGKSTTAINLYKKGYPLVADDILAIDFNENGNPMVYPGYLHMRLSDETYNHIRDSTQIITPIRTIADKSFCDASQGYSPKPIQLKRIYVLEKGEHIKVSALTSQKDLINLLIHSTAHRVFNQTEQSNNLKQCANLINNIQIRRLEIIHSYEDISKIMEVIEEDLTKN